MRGEVSMLGADVSLFEGTQLHISLIQGDKKTVFHLRAQTDQEARISCLCPPKKIILIEYMKSLIGK